MTTSSLLRAYRPATYAEYQRLQAFLSDPMSFSERFDGVLIHLGRWPYEHIAEVFDVLTERQLDRYANGGTREQWESDQQAVRDALELAGWTWEEFDYELESRLAAKFA